MPAPLTRAAPPPVVTPLARPALRQPHKMETAEEGIAIALRPTLTSAPLEPGGGSARAASMGGGAGERGVHEPGSRWAGRGCLRLEGLRVSGLQVSGPRFPPAPLLRRACRWWLRGAGPRAGAHLGPPYITAAVGSRALRGGGGGAGGAVVTPGAGHRGSPGPPRAAGTRRRLLPATGLLHGALLGRR